MIDLSDYKKAVINLVKARRKVMNLRRTQEEGTVGNKLSREAYKALSQLEDAYQGVSAARGEVVRLERRIKNQLFRELIDTEGAL
ncbi:hypothetical protein vBValSX1_113 [Vibrio phage vB_ValS_X1]|uniref:Uncharacterized protein n=1 Tax=Vibrio phage vB_ValS_X1 TaxID=2736341 RepID=A0A6M9Z748_9CAUD|nr:hypothetical protein vBValSX1_113 [Vibrio phage vB_ValS_X1]